MFIKMLIIEVEIKQCNVFTMYLECNIRRAELDDSMAVDDRLAKIVGFPPQPLLRTNGSPGEIPKAAGNGASQYSNPRGVTAFVTAVGYQNSNVLARAAAQNFVKLVN